MSAFASSSGHNSARAFSSLECALDGGQFQAAVLTGCWAWQSSYCAGLTVSRKCLVVVIMSRVCGGIADAASIYIEALHKPDQYLTEKGTPLKDDILHAPYPKGTAGATTLHPPQTH